MQQLGHALKKIRVRRKLTQTHVADALSKHQTKISKVELGREDITLQQLEKLRYYYGFSSLAAMFHEMGV